MKKRQIWNSNHISNSLNSKIQYNLFHSLPQNKVLSHSHPNVTLRIIFKNSACNRPILSLPLVSPQIFFKVFRVSPVLSTCSVHHPLDFAVLALLGDYIRRENPRFIIAENSSLSYMTQYVVHNFGSVVHTVLEIQTE